MMRRLALLTTATLILVPPSLYAQATLTRGGGGTIGVLGPASAFQTTGASATHLARAHGVGTTAHMQPNMQNQRKGGGGGGNGGGCTIYGFISGLSGSSTLSSIGVFDLTGKASGNFSLGSIAAPANAAGGTPQTGNVTMNMNLSNATAADTYAGATIYITATST